MRFSSSFHSAMTAWGLSCVLVFVLSAAPMPAWAQAHSATDHAPAPVNLRDTPLARSNTPQEVINGTAQLLGHYNPNAKLRLVLGLNHPNMAEEEEFLRELQDKKSPNYHKFLTAEEWNSRFAPSAKDEQAVVDWATNNGLIVTQRYANRLIVDVEGTVQAIETAFGVEINSYQVGENSEFSNDRDPAIPANLTDILHSVGGLNSIQRARSPHEGTIHQSPDYSPGNAMTVGQPMHANGNRAAYAALMKAREAKRQSALKSGAKPQVTNGFLDPTDIYSSYGYDFDALQNLGHCCNPTGNPGNTPPTTSIAIATAGDFATTDIEGFQAQYPYLAYNFNRVYKDGTPSCCNDETTLDTEWSIATANSFGSYVDTSYVWVYEGANNHLSTFTDVYNQMLSDGNARVFSTSWGCAELTCADSGTMDTDHGIFNSMLGQGWTIMALSHDYGATGGCDDALRVTYPGSDPDIVSVGGTSLAFYTDGTFDFETAWQGGTASGSCSHNNGGSGGGCSAYWAAPGYQSSPYCGSSSRSVPDVALNAGYGQNYYFNGKLSGVGGTSIATPQVAGFMAQADAYLLSLGSICGINNGTLACAPMGEVDYSIYYEGYNPDYAPHYPFYDITSGCNNNDVTALYGLGYYCADGPDYSAIVGWGSFNALQMAWMINYSTIAAPGPAYVTFGGPTTSAWYNSDQLVDWDVSDTAGSYTSSGIAGYSQAWDVDPGDSYSETSQGIGNSFYSGPQHVNSTFGCTDLNGSLCTGGPVSQGCHTVNVRAWDNMGFSSGDQTYGPVCYDTVPPVTSDSLGGTKSGSDFVNSATVTLKASDPGYPTTGSGVKSTSYQVNGGAVTTYTGPFAVAVDGANTVSFYSTDVAGNVGSTGSASFAVTSTTAVGLASSLNPAPSGKVVGFTATVKSFLSGTPTGNVTFKDGATVLGTVTLSSDQAVFTSGALAVGSHSITATYNGATYFLAKTSGVVTEVILNSTATALISSRNPSTYGQGIKLQATVTHTGSGTPTGTVTFKIGGTVLGTGPLSAGKATLSVPLLPVGTDPLTAVYSGDSNFYTSTSAKVNQVVDKATTATAIISTPNPSTSGEKVTFTAQVKSSTTGTPAGPVTFYDGATKLGTAPLASGKASFSITTLAVGTHNITAVYAGNGDYVTSTSGILHQVVN